MASMNPFDLLVDDAEDPSQIAVALPKKVEKSADLQPSKPAKMPSKPLPPSQAVRESRNAPSGGRGGGGGAGGRGGFARGRGGGFNRDFRNNDSPGNENGFSGGYRPSEDADGGRRGGTVGGYRGRGGGRRGGFANGESGDVERPRRTYERRSGTGRGTDLKREGGGRGNWGTAEDDIAPATEEATTEVEKSPVAEKQGGEDEPADANKETSAEEQAEKEAENKEMTLEEYEKILEEKKKALQATKVEERKVDTKEFESMQQLSNKKNTDEEIFIKLGSDKDKRKDAAEKAKKSLSINEFLKPAGGAGGYRGGRGGRRGGRGERGEGANGGGNQRTGNQRSAAPAIGDTAQFPSLGGK